MLTKEEVKHIAKLARLGITPKEEEKFAKDLSSILDYIEKLKEADISNVDPMSYSLGTENVMRPDEASEKSIRQLGERNERLLELAPDKKEGYLKVKQILNGTD